MNIRNARVEASVAGELALLDPAVRASQQAIEDLLHPDFAERGQSGRWWSRDETLRVLPIEADAFDRPEVSDLLGSEIANGVVLVTYVSGRGSGSVGRSSLWVEHEGRMRIRWHQGTPLRPNA